MDGRSPQSLLIDYAYAHKLASKELARGLCFQASIELAREAVGLGLGDQAELIRWRIKGDPDFVEHWALLLEGGTVLDLTVAQVDAESGPIKRLDDYPKAFGTARRYPVNLVLNALSRFRADVETKYSRRLLLDLHRKIFVYEASRALRSCSITGVAKAVAHLVDDAIMLFLGYLLERAIGRLSSLLRKVG